jgi:predicted nucleotidyltransferase
MDINVSAEKFYEYIKSNGWIIFETIVGSQAYGTNTPESDKDLKFIYCLPDYLYGFIPQLHVNKDYVGFELEEFMQLIGTANPTLLELLSSPEDCIISKHPVFDLILKEKNKFITKKCADSFGGYSRAQIKKAKGQDKMMNWEKEKMVRKNPIDFCYMIDDYGTKSLKKFLKENGQEQKFCGIVNIPNARDLFALFYDWKAHNCFAKSMDEEDKEHNKKAYKDKGETVGLGYKGLEKESDLDNSGISNNLRLSSIPKGEKPCCIFSYNKDAYTQHCRDYNKYQNWLKARNMQRWVDIQNHGQKIDGKNMLHCMRLIDMSVEIAEGKGIIVRRPNAKELLNIRKGKVDLDTIIKIAEQKIKKMDELFEKSNLPKKVDHKFIENLTNKIRKEFHEKN